MTEDPGNQWRILDGGGTLRVIACTRDGFTRARATALRRYFFQQS